MPVIFCDCIRIRQVLLNLVSNAARFTEKGGITVTAKRDNEHILISIADTGLGIHRRDSERIFEPFFQGSIRSVDGGGSGLGLSISRQFVEMHKGHIWLESEPGAGTTFFVRLPISPMNLPAFSPQRWLNEDWTWQQRTSHTLLPQSPYGERVILCDETKILGKTIRQMQDNIEYIETGSLEEAQKQLALIPAHLLLVNVPDSDQLLAFAYQAQSLITDTPIVICSYRNPFERVYKSGALNYLTKPVRTEKLVEVLGNLETPVRTILIVDDNADLQQLLMRTLIAHDKNLEVVTANDGSEALAKMRQHQPDLVLLDLVLPGMDGWEILAHKANDSTIKDIATIIMSSQDLLDQPMKSAQFIVTMRDGFTSKALLHYALELSRLLLDAPET